MNLRASVIASITLAAASFLAQSQSRPQSSTDPPAPEIARLAEAFVGDWDNTETMEKSEYFANGGGRHGNSHWRLAVGGTAIVGEGHSDGSAGPLDHLILIWWDKRAGVYQYFVCFKDVGSACLIRGTAHWEGANFVDDYEETEHGKKVKWRDSFVDITPNSYTLIAARQEPDGKMKTLITTRAMRR